MTWLAMPHLRLFARLNTRLFKHKVHITIKSTQNGCLNQEICTHRTAFMYHIMNEMESLDQESFEVEMLENVANKEDLIRVNFFQKFVICYITVEISKHLNGFMQW